MSKARKYAGQSSMVIVMLWLVILTGCAPKTVYVKESSKPVQIKSGQIAPFDGWLLNNGAIIDLLECCAAAQ